MPPLSMKEIDDALALELDDSPWGFDEEDGWREDGARPMYAVLTMERRVREVSMEEWINYFVASPRRIISSNVSGVIVSTTFVGVNVGLTKPLWFESMVFGGELDGYTERYETHDEALVGHNLIATTIREAMRDAMKAGPHVERVRRNNVVR